jgi:galactoside O-acetyltransferase
MSLKTSLIKSTRWFAPKPIKEGVARSAIVNFRNVRSAPNVGLTVGARSMVYAKILFDRERAHVSIGRDTYVGASKIVSASKVEIGDNVLISWGVTLVDHDSHSIFWDERKNDVANWYDGRKEWGGVETAPIKICNKAWIGFGATVLKGVTVGEGAVIGACSVVTKDVAPYTIVAGNPARPIRELRRPDLDESAAE